MSPNSIHIIGQATHNEYQTNYQHLGSNSSTETAASPTRLMLQKLAAKLSPVIEISSETLNLPGALW